MKRIVAVFLVVSYLFGLCSCEVMEILYREDTAYCEAITSFFAALDQKDKKALLALFSPAVQEQDDDLGEQIDQLLSVYPGPTDEIGWDELLTSGGSRYDGERISDADAIFPVRSGDTYYWCYLKLMYENTVDESQIGITQVDFYTADEYCIFRYDPGAKLSDEAGLSVHAEQTLEEEVRCIAGMPHKYTPCEEPLDIAEIKKFFETSNRYSEFTAHFGQPNACHIFYYYELPVKNGQTRYLEIGTNDDNGTIYGADIVDDLRYIETVFDEEE